MGFPRGTESYRGWDTPEALIAKEKSVENFLKIGEKLEKIGNIV